MQNFFIGLLLLGATTCQAQTTSEAPKTANTEINATDKKGVTVLMRAAYQQQIQVVESLLKRGADINASDDQGLTALMRACQVLAIHRRSSSGTTIYQWPSSAMVALLLKSGANVNARDKEGQSALLWLTKSNPALSGYSASPNSAKPMIVEKRNAQITVIARLLIANGADVSLVTHNGNTAMKWAKVRDNKPLITLLEAARAQ